MPLHQLAVAPADVSGARLALALNAVAPDPLATCRLTHPSGGALSLGVLGASHVVTVEHGTVRFSEQVSCTAGDDLPSRSGAPGYRIESRTEEHGEATFRALARQLRERCAKEICWLGGVFPGDDAALTALAAQPDGSGWQWQTWHLYPNGTGGTVVHTASRWHP
ncbi:DUF2617 family protein [Mycobacterium asiaticum]|uniref:DUF2617 family protein n=1 Tax=Mycobacterium asiaticum TaxID=1790 RepID=UPI00056B9931|nr:DUF2617 family protein [Mycobacterium asiaticum]OBJ55559.1 hypothetical protein A9W94_19535 [Mycobacterium asiaticum]ORA10116.1 hypothetical protein BST16_22880 [Mycobacterium asiaticum DSM 44297]